MKLKILDIYTDYLISFFGFTTATGLSRIDFMRNKNFKKLKT